MTSGADKVRDRAKTRFNAGDYGECLQSALEGLKAAPDDVELLVLAGRAGVEVDAPDAVDHLRRATELVPDDAEVWHYFGEALATDGQMEEANAAFRRTVQLDPQDQIALSHLGHTAIAAGRGEEGVEYLTKAADIAHEASTASISLVDMYRTFGQYEDALAQAKRVVGSVPGDPLAWLDVAELSLQIGELDEAYAAFERIRELDDVPGHEAYPLHGMLQVEIRRRRWDQAERLANQAAAIEPRGLSTDLAAFIQAQRGEASEEPPPSEAEVEKALSASLVVYRRMLTEDRHLEGEETIG